MSAAALQVQPITARVTRRPQYLNANLSSWGLWYRSNEPTLKQYFAELGGLGQDEFEEFAASQYEAQRALARNPADYCVECGGQAWHTTYRSGHVVGICDDCK